MTSDWKKDLLFVRHDQASVTPQQILQAIEKEGFTGKLVSNGEKSGE